MTQNSTNEQDKTQATNVDEARERSGLNPTFTLGDSGEHNLTNRGFKSLVVWQRAVQLAISIYFLTAKFPGAERFGMTSQMRRAAVSVASNIAEGYGRSTTGEFRQSLGFARGSNCELETQLIIAKKLGFGSLAAIAEAEKLIADVSRLLRGFMLSLGRGRDA